MRLTRLYIPDTGLAAGCVIALSPEQAHYLLRVLRLETGQEIVLFNALSGAWRAAIRIAGKQVAATALEQIQPPATGQDADIYLLVSPLKKEAWDFCLEKATELGVDAVRPVLMHYTQNTRVNLERSRANLVEAAQQCERVTVPELLPPEKLETLLRQWDAERVLYVALERSAAAPALAVFKPQQKAAILVGPEGGFSPQERALLERYPFVRPVALGKLVLRAETAALSALSLWMASCRATA